MENRSQTTLLAEPDFLKDEMESVRRPAADETPDIVEVASLREATRRIRLGRSIVADALIGGD
jgi:hypothetical protein